MEINGSLQPCRNCSFQGIGSYCSNCGQSYKIERITLRTVLHDVFHLFTHLDKGFGYTLKQLVVNPGHMQREYIEGRRKSYQKPFSMFFICATIAALARYWIFSLLIRYYGAGNVSEAEFFHRYMVIVHASLLPAYTLINYVLFRSSGYNYAEVGVGILYSMSFSLLAITLISFLKFIWPEMDTALIELPVILVYFLITSRNFFKNEKGYSLYIKAIISVCLTFLLAHFAEDLLITLLFD